MNFLLKSYENHAFLINYFKVLHAEWLYIFYMSALSTYLPGHCRCLSSLSTGVFLCVWATGEEERVGTSVAHMGAVSGRCCCCYCHLLTTPPPSHWQTDTAWSMVIPSSSSSSCPDSLLLTNLGTTVLAMVLSTWSCHRHHHYCVKDYYDVIE